LTHRSPRVCSATGWPVAEWLACPLTDRLEIGILQSYPLAETVCSSIG
jgi:hypothetical protein